jgi:hypothetical protein
MTAQQLAKELGITSNRDIYYVPHNDFNTTHNPSILGKVYRIEAQHLRLYTPVGNLEVAIRVLFYALELKRKDIAIGSVIPETLELNHKAHNEFVKEMSKLTGFSWHFTHKAIQFWQKEGHYNPNSERYLLFIENILKTSAYV